MPSKPDESYPDEGKPDEGKPDGGKPDEGKPDAGKPDSSSGEEGGTEVIGSVDGSEWVTWKPTTTTKNPWAWEPTIVTPPPVVDNDPLPELSGKRQTKTYTYKSFFRI